MKIPPNYLYQLIILQTRANCKDFSFFITRLDLYLRCFSVCAGIIIALISYYIVKLF